MSVQAERMWTSQDVSEFLGVPVATLYKWRCEGAGPVARKVGRHLRYFPEDVRSWVRARQEDA